MIFYISSIKVSSQWSALLQTESISTINGVFFFHLSRPVALFHKGFVIVLKKVDLLRYIFSLSEGWMNKIGYQIAVRIFHWIFIISQKGKIKCRKNNSISLEKIVFTDPSRFLILLYFSKVYNVPYPSWDDRYNLC